jgi:hypothetical protein
MVTDNQVRRLFRLSKTEKNEEIAASKAGMDVKTARKYRAARKLPTELRQERVWRTRPDPFAEVWEELQKQIQASPGLEAKTLFEALQREQPGRFAEGQLRTLQRKIKTWRATAGPAQEVFFSQKHEPGRLCASDFTHMTELGVMIGGQSFPHMLYHFVLTYSNWETAMLCYSENFEGLSEGLQNALWELGAIPDRHRTDSLSSAVNNMSDLEEFTDRYKGLLKYYGLEPERIQVRKANQNGDIEQRHHRLKRAVEQELLLRGNRDFARIEEYQAFLTDLLKRLNAGRRQRLSEEMAVMKPLPERRMDSYKREQVRVDSGSLVWVDRNTYSVNSRLIGERVEARLYLDRVEIWYAQKKVEEMPRLRGRSKHRVDYRHIIDWLVRKPGAFESYRYREDLFPSSQFRMAYDLLRETQPQRANKEYLKILELAAKQSEVRVEDALRMLLAQEEPEGLHSKAVEALLAETERIPLITVVTIAPVDLKSFDELYTEREAVQ